MTTVMAFGSFDVVHPGHYYYLNEAKKLGDSFVVVVARDANIEKFKGFKPKYHEKERVEHVRSLNIADKVVIGYEEDVFEIVEEMNPDVLALGYDQKPSDEEVMA